jgi:hypothetical protein
MPNVIVPALVIATLAATAPAAAAAAAPEYKTIVMQVDVDRPAAQAWSKVGKYCDISQWLNLDCTITQGTGDIGTVRALAGGRVLEILVGKTDLSYGYTQPVKEGEFYSLYHGYLEAKPKTAKTSTLVYTLLYDVSDKPDQAAKDADVARRRGLFEVALKKMKEIAER